MHTIFQAHFFKNTLSINSFSFHFFAEMNLQIFLLIAMIGCFYAAPIPEDMYSYDYKNDDQDLTLDDIYSMELASPTNTYRQLALDSYKNKIVEKHWKDFVPDHMDKVELIHQESKTEAMLEFSNEKHVKELDFNNIRIELVFLENRIDAEHTKNLEFAENIKNEKKKQQAEKKSSE